MSSNYFTELNSLDVGSHIEKKNNLSYLSWAWAWAEAKKKHPDMNRVVYENSNGWNYHTDSKTCWVKVGVTINGIEHIDMLPVMDFRNKSISLEAVTSFDVNKAIQRATVKALALHGVGLYIYAGEDLPEPLPVQCLSTEQIAVIKRGYTPDNIQKYLVACKVTDLTELPYGFYDNAVQYLDNLTKSDELHMLQKKVADALKMLNNPSEAKNSIKKHLGVDRIQECSDIDRLIAFFDHTTKKVMAKNENPQ